MKTIIAQHKEFTMDNLHEEAQHVFLFEARAPDPDRLAYLIQRAVAWVLPVGAEWDNGTGEVYIEHDDDEVPPTVTLNLENLAYVIIGAVTSEAWARPLSMPGHNEDGTLNEWIVFGWSPFPGLPEPNSPQPD